MNRFHWMLVAPIFFVATPLSPLCAGETGVKDTIIYLQKLQTSTGGFLSMAPQPNIRIVPALRATSSAIRALHYLGGDIPDKAAAAKFVESCFDPQLGGFSEFPGGKPDVFVTAVGAMAVVELKMPRDRYAEPVIKYLSENAKTFEDIRIAVAGLESLAAKSPRNDDWLKEIGKMMNDDGTFGSGTEQARATGSAVVAMMRLGAKIDKRDKVLSALNEGQRKTGGYGRANAADASDLDSTYRVMRCFMMLKSRPDKLPALEAFIAKCRNSDGGYGVAPGQPSTVSGTYCSAIIRHWLKS